MADILFGDANPGGKLPVTFPRSVGQLTLTYNEKPSAHRGYLLASKEPLFPFGFGLSYTSFEIGSPLLSAGQIKTDGTVNVTVEVRNTGKVAGDEVVQLYVRDLVSSVTQPVKKLRGFQRVTLAPGAATTVNFTIGREALALWDKDMKYVVEPGSFEIMVGTEFRRSEESDARGHPVAVFTSLSVYPAGSPVCILRSTKPEERTMRDSGL